MPVEAPPPLAPARVRMIDAAIEAILDLGYYRATSNEIARRAEVTWGAIQHHFGTRERLMLSAFEAACADIALRVTAAQVSGDSVEARLRSVQDVIFEFYGRTSYTAILQVMWNLISDPATADEVRTRVAEIVETLRAEYLRLLLDISPDTTMELARFCHTAMWGVATAQAHQQLLGGRLSTEPDEQFAYNREQLVRSIAVLLSSSAPAAAVDS